MFEFMIGFFVVESATSDGGELSLTKFLVFSAMICIGIGLLALNACISSDGDVKNTISVIKQIIEDRYKR